MTALAAVAAHLPAGRTGLDELAAALAMPPIQARMFRRYQGLAEVRRDPDGSLLDLLAAAVGELPALRECRERVRYVLYARTFPVVVPYPVNPLHELCRRFGLDGAVAFTVTHHACATSLLAIDIAGRLLAVEPRPDALALVVAGEKAFTRDAQVQPGVTVFSEGAGACLVRCSGERDVLLSYATSLHGADDLELTEAARRFETEYPVALAEAVCAAVDRAGLTLDDIALILPHNVNVVCWQRLCRRIGLPVERVLLDNVPAVGHSFCADPFVNYRTAREHGRLRRGDHYLVAAAGAARGATFSAMVFRH